MDRTINSSSGLLNPSKAAKKPSESLNLVCFFRFLIFYSVMMMTLSAARKAIGAKFALMRAKSFALLKRSLSDD